MAAHPRRGAELPIKYSAEQPDRALLLTEPTHYDYVWVIFGAYFLGYGLFLGYKLCTRR
jgi:hypothetical protein